MTWPRARAAALALLAAATVAGCSSSAGVHTQDPTGAPTRSAPTTATSTSTSPSPSWTPPNYGTARPAVDAYLRFEALLDKAFRDPAHVSAAIFDRYLAGQARQLFDSELMDERSQGKAYRGGTPLNHVRVVQDHRQGAALPWLLLRDCQTNDPKDPSVEYYVATGEPVSSDPSSLTPYASTIKVFLIKRQWTITQFAVDTTKACVP